MYEARLKEILDDTRTSQGQVVFLTGAGISAESGIPTFRGKEGYWVVDSRNYHPQELATWSAFCQMPDEIWAWYLYRRTICRRAEPNPAHAAVARLEEDLGARFLLITQNVDGLHIRAGNSLERTYQIHGNIDFMRCADECSVEIYPLPESVGEKEKGESLTDAEREALHCPTCHRRARPHVLWFDESYDEAHFRFNSSVRAAKSCKLLVIVGTSGSTNLPNQVAELAAQAGAHVIDINPDRNPFSALAGAAGGLWLEGSATEKVPGIVEGLLA